MTAPLGKTLRHSGKRRCPGCHEWRPQGWFSTLVQLDGRVKLERIEHEVCRRCRV